MERDRDRHNRLRDIHEREVALQIADLYRKRRERADIYWDEFNKKRDQPPSQSGQSLQHPPN